jgi:DinB family protein
MNRAEIEIKLNRERAAMLEAYLALPESDVSRGVTPSQHDSSVLWSAKDHLVHLAGVENHFGGMIRRHLEGDPSPVPLPKDKAGNLRPREEIMAYVHAMNDKWIAEHRGKSFDQVVALAQKVRSETLALLASLTDEQLQEKVSGAPWGDGTVGGILAIIAGHGQMHYNQVEKALAADKK